MSSRRFLFGLSLVAAVGLLFHSFALYGSPSKESGGVIAKIGNRTITEDEVDSKLKSQLTALQVQLYDLRKNAIEVIADDYVVQTEAKKANLSVDQYWKREVTDKIPQPPEAQVRGLYEQFKGQIKRPYDQAHAEIVGYIKNQEETQVKDDLLRKLREDHGLKIMMKAPRFEVEIAGDPSLGSDKAPVTVVEFTDFQCPFCQRAQSTIEQLRTKYGDKVRLVHADFPLYQIHQNAMPAALAARCAGDQGKFWQYRDALFADQSKLKPADLKATAGKLGLDATKFSACFDKNKYEDQVRGDFERGHSLGVSGTPAFFINGRPVFGARPFQDLAAIVDEELAASQKKVASSD